MEYMGPTSHNIMKIKLLYFLFILTIIGLSCEDSKFPDEQFSVQDIKYGTCKPATKSVLNEYILLSVKDEYYIDFNHINSYFNCSPGQIIIKATLVGNNIQINEYETDPSANCICPYDLEFRIGPLQYDTYVLTLKKGGFEILVEEFVFKSDLNKRIDIT